MSTQKLFCGCEALTIPGSGPTAPRRTPVGPLLFKPLKTLPSAKAQLPQNRAESTTPPIRVFSRYLKGVPSIPSV